MAKNVYAMFDMDNEIEEKGFWAEYGAFRVRIARMEVTNTAYKKLLSEIGKKHKNIGKNKKIPEKVIEEINNEILVKAIVKDWEVLDEEKSTDEKDVWTPNTIHSYPSGEVVEATQEEILNVLNNLPELRKDIEAQSNTKDFFLKEYQDEVIKN